MGISESTLDEIAQTNLSAVRDFQDGNQQALHYLIGCILKESSGNVGPAEAEEAIREHLSDNVVEVTLPYDDYYSVSEKISEIDGIPDTQAAYDTFKYPPQPSITFEWDKDECSLTPVSIEICGVDYELSK